MFADAAVPPTFFFDWGHLPMPFGLIAAMVAILGLVLLFTLLARRGKPIRNGWLLLLCLTLFVLFNLISFVIGTEFFPRRSPRPTPPSSEQKETDKATLHKNSTPNAL